MPAPSSPPMTMPGPKMPPEPPEPIDSDVARIFANGRTSTIHSGTASSDCRSRPAWTKPYPVPSTPGMTSAMQPTANPAIAGLTAAWQRPACEPVGQAVEVGRRTAGRRAPQAMPISAYQPSCAGFAEAEPRLRSEDRAEALDRAEDRVGDDRRDERRDERLGLDVVAVEELGPEDRAAERRAEDRPDARGHPDGDRDPRVARVEVEDASEEGPEAGADLRCRALAAARPARADRDRRRDQLDGRDPRPDAARMVVKGGDRGVGAVALGLGREAEHDDPGDQPAERDDERDRPGPRGVGDRRTALTGSR